MSFAFLVLLALADPGAAVVDLPPEVEVEMALSAAPEDLRAGAGVWRLAGRGYLQMRPSANGFTCLVSRDASQGLAPVCYDREGSDTLLAADLVRGRLIREGRTDVEAQAEIDRLYADGSLIAPRRGGVAYMLSSQFSQHDPASGRRVCVYPPHLMFYVPYMSNADIGAPASARGSMTRPWVLNEGKPNAYVIVVPHDTHTACD
jgi:hypothetical protein